MRCRVDHDWPTEVLPRFARLMSFSMSLLLLSSFLLDILTVGWIGRCCGVPLSTRVALDISYQAHSYDSGSDSLHLCCTSAADSSWPRSTSQSSNNMDQVLARASRGPHTDIRELIASRRRISA